MGLVPAASLQKDKEKKKEVRKETYRKILEIVSRKIKNAAEMNQVHIMVTIPPWVLGCPVYDLLLATNYIERQIKNGGYRTARINESSMYVNWEKDQRQITPGDGPDHRKTCPGRRIQNTQSRKFKKGSCEVPARKVSENYNATQC